MNKQVVLITGASRGIGKDTSLLLADAGFHVVASMRDTSKQQELIQEAKEQGIEPNIEIVQLDITDELSTQRAVSKIIKKHGQINILINNAGYCLGGFTEEVSMEDWTEQLNTNVLGSIRVTKACIPYMRENEQGKIIFLSSLLGRMPLPSMAPYDPVNMQ